MMTVHRKPSRTISRNGIFFLLLIPGLLGVTSCFRDARPLEERLKEALDDRLQQYEVKGASAAVVMPDGSICRTCAGVSHDTVAMKPRMLFATGSITKNMVAALVFQLAEEGISLPTYGGTISRRGDQ